MHDTPGKILSSFNATSERRRDDNSKPSGCAGVFFQFLDRLNGKRLLPHKLLPAERPKRSFRKHKENAKLPMAKLLMIADENRTNGLSRMAQEDPSSKEGPKCGKQNTRSLSVVARLMGLETIPLPEPNLILGKEIEKVGQHSLPLQVKRTISDANGKNKLIHVHGNELERYPSSRIKEQKRMNKDKSEKQKYGVSSIKGAIVTAASVRNVKSAVLSRVASPLSSLKADPAVRLVVAGAKNTGCLYDVAAKLLDPGLKLSITPMKNSGASSKLVGARFDEKRNTSRSIDGSERKTYIKNGNTFELKTSLRTRGSTIPNMLLKSDSQRRQVTGKKLDKAGVNIALSKHGRESSHFKVFQTMQSSKDCNHSHCLNATPHCLVQPSLSSVDMGKSSMHMNSDRRVNTEDRKKDHYLMETLFTKSASFVEMESFIDAPHLANGMGFDQLDRQQNDIHNKVGNNIHNKLVSNLNENHVRNCHGTLLQDSDCSSETLCSDECWQPSPISILESPFQDAGSSSSDGFDNMQGRTLPEAPSSSTVRCKDEDDGVVDGRSMLRGQAEETQNFETASSLGYKKLKSSCAYRPMIEICTEEDYVNEVVKVFVTSKSKLPHGMHLSVPVLDSSLFDELEEQLQDTEFRLQTHNIRKLYFDCIDEALMLTWKIERHSLFHYAWGHELLSPDCLLNHVHQQICLWKEMAIGSYWNKVGLEPWQSREQSEVEQIVQDIETDVFRFLIEELVIEAKSNKRGKWLANECGARYTSSIKLRMTKPSAMGSNL